MAEGKKSFVLYADSMDIVNDLSDEQAGKLIKLIVNYVSDRNPESDDLLINIAFKPIKLQLKRDLEKWNDIKVKRSESGKLGGRPKTIESEENQNESKKANGFFDNQNEAKKAVSVNDTVNVTVTDINNTYTTETAFQIFDKSNLNGRFFSTMCHLNSLDESEVISEFKRWQIYHKGNDFKDEKAIRNSFSKWMSNYKPEKKTETKKFESKIDWDEIKKEMS